MPGPLVTGFSGSALFEDRGRRLADSGVPTSGAFDRHAHAAATALVGGSADDAALEVVGRIEVLVPAELASGVTCAVTGRGGVTVQGRAAAMWTALQVPAGGRLAIQAEGRAYLAVAGGFRPPVVLGSRSACLLGPIGPPPIALGDRLPLDADCSSGRVGDFARPPVVRSTVRVAVGPHLRLAPCDVRVVEASRIGIRLAGGQLGAGGRESVGGRGSTGGRASTADRATAARLGSLIRSDLPSLGVLPGALQVLPSGDWMLLGPDAGTMGGYPVAGVALSADLDLMAHARPGDALHLEPVDAWATAEVQPVSVVHVSALSS